MRRPRCFVFDLPLKLGSSQNVKTKAQDTPLSLCMCPPAFTLWAVEPSALPPLRLGNVQTSLTLLSACRRFVGSARLRLDAKVMLLLKMTKYFSGNIL